MHVISDSRGEDPAGSDMAVDNAGLDLGFNSNHSDSEHADAVQNRKSISSGWKSIRMTSLYLSVAIILRVIILKYNILYEL